MRPTTRSHHAAVAGWPSEIAWIHPNVWFPRSSSYERIQPDSSHVRVPNSACDERSVGDARASVKEKRRSGHPGDGADVTTLLSIDRVAQTMLEVLRILASAGAQPSQIGCSPRNVVVSSAFLV